MQQQGDYYPHHQQKYDQHFGLEISHMLTIHTTPFNPHTDIHPTGQHEVILREVLMRMEGTTVEKQLACIYTPDGTCRYTLTPERTAILQAQYNHTKTHKPRLMQKLKAGTFAEEVYKLMTRYKDGALVNPTTHTRIKIKNHWATPDCIYEALQTLTGATKERFASPLNYNPTHQMYWSIHKQDQVFGAKWDAYKYKWTGSSIHNPEYEDEDLNRNVSHRGGRSVTV
jgi:hypothetical protein